MGLGGQGLTCLRQLLISNAFDFAIGRVQDHNSSALLPLLPSIAEPQKWHAWVSPALILGTFVPIYVFNKTNTSFDC